MNEEFEKQKTILENLYRCRDLELNNLWQKSIFLAPFLILCFTGYGFLLYELFKERPFSIGMNVLCIALCVISAIFSMLWIYMFKGSKAQYELCERAIANYEQRELNIPYGYAMGTLKYDEIEFNDNLLSTKAGKFSPSKINIVIGQVSLITWLATIIFHIGYLFSELLIRNYDEYDKFIKAKSVTTCYIIFLLFSILGVGVLIYCLYNIYTKKIQSSYLSVNNEEKYIKDFKSIKTLILKESKENCWFVIKSFFRRSCSHKNTISVQKRFILESLQEIYNISKERVKQLEELSEKALLFPLTNKEKKYVEKCKEFVEKGWNIEKYKELLNCFASALGIEEKRMKELNKYIREKYQE